MSSDISKPEDECQDDMKGPLFALKTRLASYASEVREAVFITPSASRKVTVILGNPSCDLDSFVSAFLLSYFYNCGLQRRDNLYVPILNLPDVDPADLRRLRPEFGVAMRYAIDGWSKRSDSNTDDAGRREKTLLEQLITIKEIRENAKVAQSLREAFRLSQQTEPSTTCEKQVVILVDHNAPSIPGIVDTDLESRFDVVGCIDHHIDESYVPSHARPRIVITGIGSCTSLIVKHLRDVGLWSHPDRPQSDAASLREICKLALAPILIDTANLTAKGDKCSDTDRDAVAFLGNGAGKDFDRQQLFDEVSAAKAESLNLLTMSETFARDYKQWEVNAKSGEIVIGMSSMVKSIDWLVNHAGGQQEFVKSVINFAQSEDKGLDLLGMLTWTGTGKELAIFSFSREGEKSIRIFQQNATELQLQAWNEVTSLADVLDQDMATTAGWSWKIWKMGDTSKSRKQVAPLLRNAVKDMVAEQEMS